MHDTVIERSKGHHNCFSKADVVETSKSIYINIQNISNLISYFVSKTFYFYLLPLRIPNPFVHNFYMFRYPIASADVGYIFDCYELTLSKAKVHKMT